MMLRILASLILLLSILFMPLWVSVVLALAGMVYFSFFYEAVALLFLSDLLYGVREARYFGIVFVSLIISVVFLVMVELLKKKLKFYA